MVWAMLKLLFYCIYEQSRPELMVLALCSFMTSNYGWLLLSVSADFTNIFASYVVDNNSDSDLQRLPFQQLKPLTFSACKANQKKKLTFLPYARNTFQKCSLLKIFFLKGILFFVMKDHRTEFSNVILCIISKRLESVRVEVCHNAFFFKIGKCQNC